MRIDDNITFLCLPENPGQHHDRKYFGIDQILEHFSRTHRRKLIDISYKNQSCPRDHRRQKRMHQRQIHHGHFINNYHICFQRILLISPESSFPCLLRISTDFQKAVNCLRLISGRLCHPFGGASCRRGKTDIHPFTQEIADHGIDRGCLSGSRPSCQDKDTVFYRLCHRFSLSFIQRGLILLFQLFNPFPDQTVIFLVPNIQFFEHPCRIHLHVIVLCRIYADLLFILLQDNLLFHRKIHQILLNICNLHFQKLCRFC